MSSIVKVYGSAISYYTGKLEGYLRYKESPYTLIPFNPPTQRRLKKKTGTAQMPATDGRQLALESPCVPSLTCTGHGRGCRMDL